MQVRDGNKVRIRLCCLMCVPVQQRKHIKINTAIGARYRSISIGDLTRTRRRQRGQRLLGNVFIFYFSISQLSSSIQWACWMYIRCRCRRCLRNVSTGASKPDFPSKESLAKTQLSQVI